MTSKTVLSNPKTRKATWYGYYAGYSTEFVRDALSHLGLREEAVVLDPWNGSGTTTEAASKQGYHAIGFDLNPAMVIIAKARCVQELDRTSVDELLSSILSETSRRRTRVDSGDPLNGWLGLSSVRILRRLQSAIHHVSGMGPSKRVSMPMLNPDDMSGITCLFYVALFRMVKRLSSGLRSSNPTWICAPKDPEKRLDISKERLLDVFAEEIEGAIALYEASHTASETRPSRIAVASSIKLPLENNSADAVISSPPYCTRLDYVMATRLELAVLGFGDDLHLRNLRGGMIGTPTICSPPLSAQSEWGKKCVQFLKTVESHPSKGSKSYYHKNYLQYFSLICRSLTEIDRVLKPNGSCGLVVQDSYYKGIHNDLPQMVVEMGEKLGWVLASRADFQSKISLVGINSKSRSYGHTCRPVESVLIFRKCDGRGKVE